MSYSALLKIKFLHCLLPKLSRNQKFPIIVLVVVMGHMSQHNYSSSNFQMKSLILKL